jgi:hypothetical protein
MLVKTRAGVATFDLFAVPTLVAFLRDLEAFHCPTAVGLWATADVVVVFVHLLVPQCSAQLRTACSRSAFTRVGVCARAIPARTLNDNGVQFTRVRVAYRKVSHTQDGLLLFALCHFVSFLVA